ncbi:MAG: hypothetical protein HY508_13890 [Acidobacteria bacterium]|nr:hypothetical protein [Acidobacteriota bacterium]
MRHSESGSAHIKTYLTLAFLACVIYASFKILPVYVNSWEIEDYIRQQTPYWLTQRANGDVIRGKILEKARELDLPIDADQVQVDATSASVTVNLDYTVPVDLKVYVVKLHFTSAAQNKSL